MISTVPEARMISTVPEARMISTAPEAHDQHLLGEATQIGWAVRVRFWHADER